MSADPPRFEAYGSGGDYAGARRMRRAFRYAVLACLFFTFALFFSENYLRYDLLETQYIMSVTLDQPSARAILRNVVLRDSEQNERPTPRYLNALAEIEEVDAMAEAYAAAYMREPNNAFMVINYGCYLFHEGQYREARERFREAGILPPNNALPRYLEAAALAHSLEDDADFSEVLTLIVRTNNSGDPILFPEPPWHQSLPKYGYWYMKRQREIIDQCLAPLYRMKSRLVARAQTQIDSGQLQDWSSWLGSVENMAARLIGVGAAEDSMHSSATAQFGLSLKQDILALQTQILELQPRYVARERNIEERRQKLEAAQARIYTFENERDDRIAAHQALVSQPHYLVFHTCLILVLAYLLARIAMRLAGASLNTRTMQEIPVARTTLIGGLALMAFLLMLSIFMRQANGETLLPVVINTLWYGVLIMMLIFGLFYPAVWLPTPRQVVAHAPVCDSGDSMLDDARSAKMTAWLSFVVRYYGILLGGFLIVVCFWVLMHRMVESLYPTQIRLLSTGLYEEELRLVQQIQHMLGN